MVYINGSLVLKNLKNLSRFCERYNFINNMNTYSYTKMRWQTILGCLAIAYSPFTTNAVETQNTAIVEKGITLEQITGFENDLTGVLARCNNYFDSDYNTTTNFNDSASMGLNYHIGKFLEDNSNVLDVLNDEQKTKYGGQMLRVHAVRAISDIEGIMSGIKKTPRITRSIIIDEDISDSIKSASMWSGYVKDDKGILQTIGRKADRVPYESVMAYAEHYISIKKNVLSAFRKINEAAGLLLESEYTLTLDELNDFIIRSSKAVSTINESYKSSEESIRVYFRKEGELFKEQREKLKQAYHDSKK